MAMPAEPLEPLIALTPTAAPTIPCAATACPGTVAVQWRRRLTDAELADALALEQHRRDQATEDPAQPPDFGPMPTAADYTRAVYACGQHALRLDLAAHVHQATCTAPAAAIPGCDCTPEPLPSEQPPATPDTVTLPTGWVVPAT